MRGLCVQNAEYCMNSACPCRRAPSRCRSRRHPPQSVHTTDQHRTENVECARNPVTLVFRVFTIYVQPDNEYVKPFTRISSRAERRREDDLPRSPRSPRGATQHWPLALRTDWPLDCCRGLRGWPSVCEFAADPDGISCATKGCRPRHTAS